jgi:hypothetical protein
VLKRIPHGHILVTDDGFYGNGMSRVFLKYAEETYLKSTVKITFVTDQSTKKRTDLSKEQPYRYTSP